MNYIGIDGQVRNDSLMHWKYIKKIKSGSGWRYFYTPEEIRAYYKDEQSKANAQYEAKEAYSNKKLSKGLRENANAANSQMRKIGEESSLALRRWGEGRVDPRAVRKEEKRVLNIANKERKKLNRTRKIENASHIVEREVKPVANTAKAVVNKPRKEITKKAKKTAYDVNQNYKAERMVADHKWARDTNRENRRHREAASNTKYRTEGKLYQRREKLEHRVRTTKINAINKTAPAYKAAKNFVNGSYKQRTKSITQNSNRRGEQRRMFELKSKNALREAKRREQERKREELKRRKMKKATKSSTLKQSPAARW